MNPIELTLPPIYVGRFGLPLVGAKCILCMRTRFISNIRHILIEDADVKDDVKMA